MIGDQLTYLKARPFYTFIPIPIRLTELMSKRENNYNVMIIEPVDQELHMIKSCEFYHYPAFM